MSAEGLGEWFYKSSTQASSNYGIDKNGRVGMYVEEKNRSWCSSSGENDHRAVTIECASDTTEPYTMNAVVFDTLIKLCTDICKRNGKKKLLWFADKTKSLNYSPAADEMVLTVHRWFANKSCPGEWLYSRLGDLAAKVTTALCEKEDKPAPAPATETAPNSFALGSTVAIKSSAERYNPNSAIIPDWVKTDYNHIVTQVTVNGKPYNKGGKVCVLLGKKVPKKGSSIVAGIMTWVAVENLQLVSETKQATTTYTVKKGDTLWEIAKKHLGSGARYTEIVKLNGLKTSVILVGQQLKIPTK